MTISIDAEFVDTNVLAYAHDRATTTRHGPARDLVDRLIAEGNGVASVQVLQELFVTLTRRRESGISADIAHDIVVAIARTFLIVEPTVADVIAAMGNARLWQVSFWDAMVLTTANRAGAAIVWTEDLNHGQRYGGVTARDPFRAGV